MLKLRLWVVMAAVAAAALEIAAARWFADVVGDRKTKPYVRVWHDGRWVPIHPDDWPRHPLNPDRTTSAVLALTRRFGVSP